MKLSKTATKNLKIGVIKTCKRPRGDISIDANSLIETFLVNKEVDSPFDVKLLTLVDTLSSVCIAHLSKLLSLHCILWR